MTDAPLTPLNLSNRAEKEEENANVGSERKGKHDCRERLNIREHKHLTHNLQKRCESCGEHDIRKARPNSKALFFLTLLGAFLFSRIPVLLGRMRLCGCGLLFDNKPEPFAPTELYAATR